MNRTARYLFFFVLGVILAGWGYRELHHRSEYKQLSKKLNTCNMLYTSLLEAEQRTDTVIDTVTVNVPQIVYIKATDSIRDTVYQDEYIRMYNDSLVNDDLKINYTVRTKGWLQTMDLSYDIYKRTVTNEKIVYKDRPVEIKEKLHIFTGISYGINDNEFLASLSMTYKTVGGNYTYDATHNIHSAGIVLKIK